MSVQGRWIHDETEPSGFADGFHRGFAIETREGFVQPICSCGWKGRMTSDEDVALSEWTDHMAATERGAD